MSTIERARPSLSPRRLLFWLHIWVGLTFGLPFALLGITGSILVYEQPINDFFNPTPQVMAVGAIAASRKPSSMPRTKARPRPHRGIAFACRRRRAIPQSCVCARRNVARDAAPARAELFRRWSIRCRLQVLDVRRRWASCFHGLGT